MQTLTSSASITKRKQACNSCRHRKKRCDSGRPVCSLCRKWGITCEYSVPGSKNTIGVEAPFIQYPGALYPAQPSFPIDFEQDGALDFLQFPGMNFDLVSGVPDDLQATGIPTPDPSSTDSSLAGTSHISADSMSNVAGTELSDPNDLPCNQVLHQLVELFFEHMYPQLPCFHKATLKKEIQARVLHTEAPSFLYALCAISARYHQDPTIRNKGQDFYEMAKVAYDMSLRDPEPALRTIQTALLVISHGLAVGDFSASWLTVGKVWRQVSVLGLNRMDTPGQVNVYGMSHKMPQSAVVKEEYRRTLWMLFNMDRNHAWPTGWPNAIDERQFKVDIPVPDEVFQAMTAESDSDVKPAPFIRNLNTLISESSVAKQPLNTFHYLCISHVLLGRISEQIHSPHDSPDSPEYAQKCEELDSLLVKFRLSLPRTATSILEAPVEARISVVWLNIMLNAMAILLHFRSAALHAETAAAQDYFTRAVLAAKDTGQLIKDASRISPDLLLNVHIGGALYLAACVLVIHCRMSGDDSLLPDIDIFKLVFQRMEERFTFLGLKFRFALERDVERDMDSIRQLREAGLRGLLADCSKWSFVKEKAAEQGIFIT